MVIAALLVRCLETAEQLLHLLRLLLFLRLRFLPHILKFPVAYIRGASGAAISALFMSFLLAILFGLVFKLRYNLLFWHVFVLEPFLIYMNALSVYHALPIFLVQIDQVLDLEFRD